MAAAGHVIYICMHGVARVSDHVTHLSHCYWSLVFDVIVARGYVVCMYLCCTEDV